MSVEIKSVEVLAPVHRKQLLTYLRLADKRLGLLSNFHVALIKDGITRIVNGLEEADHANTLSRKDEQSSDAASRRFEVEDVARQEPGCGLPDSVAGWFPITPGAQVFRSQCPDSRRLARSCG